jgi:hypothetical protein
MIANCFSGQVNYEFNRPLAFGSELRDLGRQELRPVNGAIQSFDDVRL